MSLFTYHIPKDATYTAEDMIHVLNNERIHYVLAGESNFYSFATFFEAVSTPLSIFSLGVVTAFIPLSIAMVSGAPLFETTIYWALPAIVSDTVFTSAWLVKNIFYQGLSEMEVIHNIQNDLINDHYTFELTSLGTKWFYYQDPSDTSVITDSFTAREICYMLNTHDITSTLNHQIPENYIAPINISGENSIAVINL